MSRDITVTFADGTTHVYKGAPDDVTPEQVTQRAFQEFGVEVVSLDGGRKATPSPAPSSAPTPAVTSKAPAPVAQTKATAPAPLTAMDANALQGPSGELTKEIKYRPDVDKRFAELWRSGVKDPATLNKVLNEEFNSGKDPVTLVTPQFLGEVRRFESYWAKKGVAPETLSSFFQNTGLKDPERPDDALEQFGTSAVRSVLNMGNTIRGAAALGSDLVGADETADNLLQDYLAIQKSIELEYGAPIKTEEIDSLGDAGMWAADVTGELLPQLAGSLGAGYLGKKIGERAVAGQVAEEVAKRGAQGAIAGAASNSVVQNAGATYGDTFARTGEKAPVTSLAAGMASGALDSILPIAILKKFGGESLTNEFKKKFIREAAKEGPKGFAIEGATEATQEFINSLPEAYVTGETPFTPEIADRMWEAFWRGGFGGGTVNVAVAGIRTAGPDNPAPRYTGAPIVVPTGKKNTKAYRAQLSEVQDRVIEQVNALAEGWTNAPKIEVHDNFNKLEGIDNSAIGVYTTETLEDGSTVPVIKINTEAVLERAKKRDVKPEAIVEAVTFHESLGHHGLTSLFREDLDAFLDDIYENGSEQFRDKVDTWLRKNPGSYTKYEPQSRRILATEEVMAEWSEGGPVARTFYDNVANYIKDFARTRLGINLKYTEREVKAFLAVAHERTMAGEQVGATPSVPRNMDDERTPDTYSAGFKRPKADERSKTEARKQFWKNKENPDWNPDDPNGLPPEPKYMAGDKLPFELEIKEERGPSYQADGKTVKQWVAYAPDGKVLAVGRRMPFQKLEDVYRRIEEDATRNYFELQRGFNSIGEPLGGVNKIIRDKYMAGNGPIDPDQLTADDLIEAENALDILNRLEYTPTVISPDQLEAEAIARNLPPSDITRLVGMEPGKLMKRLFLYDIAATKLSDRAAKIKADITENGLTPEKQLAYIETTVKLSDLTSQIFNFQAEIGRTLAANRRVNFSRKRVRDLKKVLEQYGLDALADPETFFKYMATIEEQTAAGRARKAGTDLISIINIPRAIMSSADLSAPLRQGIVFVGYKEFWLSFAKMFTLIGKSGQANYQFLMKKIATDPNYELMQKARLQFSSLEGELSSREEDFQTELARKIPGFGKIVKASEQAYAGFLNKLRADMFNRFVNEYRGAGIELDEEGLKGLGAFINAGTGRAELPEFLRPSATVLNATFFSARLMYSRVQMLNPGFYAQLPAPVRKSAAKSMLRFGGVAALVIGALNALWPDEIETELDPRSSEFMKIKVGNTRFDLGGGFNQYLILGARTGSWLYNQGLGFAERTTGVDTTGYKIANKKTAAGDFREFGNEEITQDSYASVIGDFFRSKLSPQASYVLDFAVGQDFIGREFTVEGSLASRLVPMTASSVYEAYKEESPVPLPAIFTAALFGVGVNTYTSPAMDPKRELEAPVSFQMSDLADGDNVFVSVENGEVTLKKPARDAWTATLNNYYPVFIEEVSAEMGVKFEEMDDELKKAAVKEALKRTRAAAKKDMLYDLGLEE